MPWLQRELELRGFKVFQPEMPDTDNPKINTWVNHLTKVIGSPNGSTYFVGGSIGCQTIMRYLETIDSKVGDVIFVAGWFNLANLEGHEEEEIARSWIETPIDFEKVKKNTRSITVLISDDEPYNYVEENKKTFEEKLGAKVILEHGKGHFTSEDGITEIPQILEILK